MSSLKSLIVAGAAALALAPSMASAAGGGGEPVKYFAIGAGLSVPDDTEQDTSLAPFSGANNFTLPDGFDTSFDPGFNVGALVGYKFNDYWRIEGEYRYSSADIDATTTRGQFNVPTSANPGGTLTANSGDVSVHALFANAVLDINMANNLLPYLGAGIGYADVEISGLGADEGEGVFAYKVFTGLDVKMDENSWVGARFSFMNTGDFAYDPVGFDTVGGAFTLSEGQYASFDLTIAYRRKFK
ncbi:outer membrane protein [Parvularcula sp. IMCC14364]|uniref:outer membrane protein n=1 Tax=Parvularcula sp. IMCC14364 TaxID=3067902 RepID=UPI0027408CF6|nr:outer membrane beta-barrel protein [Parvularcula sp. IMCC14364]